MRAYRHTIRSSHWVSQSFVVTTGEPVPACSLQVMRKRDRYGSVDKRGWTVFLSFGPVRMEVGTR